MSDRASRRAVVSGPLVAAGTLFAAILVGHAAGFPVRDPDHVAAGYVAMVGAAVLALVGVDVAVRARRAAGGGWPSRVALAEARRARWSGHRGVAVGTALISFYVTYLAYRTLKGAVPLLRPALFDRQLARVDRGLFGGHDPAAIMHSLLGTGPQTQLLSAVYVAFIVFLPLSLAVALVFARDLSAALFVATALSLNWVLGAGSYFLFPALGPVYAHAGWFAALPHSEVTHLQRVLLDQRMTFLAHPRTAPPQAVAAFASLHIAMSFTALAAAELLGLARRLRLGLAIWLLLTFVATVYLGWHYVVDDLAGLVIGAVAMAGARLLTGCDLAAARRARAAMVPARQELSSA
jgi:hypothetical protein